MHIKYLINNRGYIIFEKGKNLKKLTSDIPNGYGTYVFHRNTKDGEILYIGKGGTIMQNGSFIKDNGGSKQFLKQRLNGKQGEIKRAKFFNQQLDEDSSLNAIVIEWMIIDENKCLPAFLEACLIQNFFEQNHRLPLWNKKF